MPREASWTNSASASSLAVLAVQKRREFSLITMKLSAVAALTARFVIKAVETGCAMADAHLARIACHPSGGLSGCELLGESKVKMTAIRSRAGDTVTCQ